MKNIARKIAYILSFAMILGVITPGVATVKADGAFAVEWNLAAEEVKFSNAGAGFVYGVAKEDTKDADASKGIYKIGDKTYKVSDIDEVEGEEGYADLSWTTGKAVAIAYGTVDDSGEYTFAGIKEIEAADKNFKAYFTGDATSATSITISKGNEVTADKLTNKVGGAEVGYFYFVGTVSGGSVGLVDKANIEWKKGANGTWAALTDANKGLDADKLEKFKSKGATLYFRLKATDSAWASKEVKAAYTKQAKAPSVKVDITKDVIGLKKGLEYRLIIDGVKYGWVNALTKNGSNGTVGNVNLADLYAGDTKITAEQLASGKVTIVVRTAATAKKLASKTYSIKLGVADTFTAATVGTSTSAAIQLAFTKNYSVTDGITITNSGDKAVEFKVLVDGDAKLADVAKWTTVKAKTPTKNTTVNIKKGVYLKENATAIATGASIVFRYPGTKGTTVVSLAGVTYSFDLTSLTTVEQKVTGVTAKTTNTVTTTAAYDDGTKTITITADAAKVASDAAVSLKYDITASGVVSDNPTLEVTKDAGNPATAAVEVKSVKISKGGTGAMEIKIPAGYTKGTYNFTVKSSAKGNITFKVKFVLQ